MPCKTCFRSKQDGLTLVELMVAIALGIIVLLAVTTIFANNSSTRHEIERSSRQLENGRYALQLLASDIRLAGYLGEFYSTAAPAALPANPCSTALADIQAAFQLHVQGYDNGNNSLSCLPDYKAGTDVIVVRRGATCSSANPTETGCGAMVAGAPYLQVSGCRSQGGALQLPPGCPSDPAGYVLDTDTANFTLHRVGSSSLASVRRFLTHIYYVANNNVAGDGIPTLKRWELSGANNPVPLVEGIESIQFEYGIDSDGNGTPNSYGLPATVADWYNVVTVGINVLSRNETPSAGYKDTKTYMLGTTSVTAFNDAYRRHVFSTTVVLENPVGRRLP